MLNTKLSWVQKLSILLISAFLFSCAKSEKNDLKEAQLCLNTSTPSEAMACVDKIASNGSAQAYKLRCAAIFISEGFNSPTSFIDALDKINNPSGTGGSSSTVGAISALSFVKSASDQARSEAVANNAFSYCSLAETDIYMQISSIFKIGTLAANIAYIATAGATPTENDIKNAIATLPSAEIGQLVVATYNSTCQNLEKASDSTKKYCEELGNAVNAGGSEANIGDCLKNNLNNPNYSSGSCQ